MNQSDLLRFFRASKRKSAIDVWVNEQSSELGPIAHEWFVLMRNGATMCENSCMTDVPWRA